MGADIQVHDRVLLSRKRITIPPGGSKARCIPHQHHGPSHKCDHHRRCEQTMGVIRAHTNSTNNLEQTERSIGCPLETGLQGESIPSLSRPRRYPYTDNYSNTPISTRTKIRRRGKGESSKYMIDGRCHAPSPDELFSTPLLQPASDPLPAFSYSCGTSMPTRHRQNEKGVIQ